MSSHSVEIDRHLNANLKLNLGNSTPPRDAYSLYYEIFSRHASLISQDRELLLKIQDPPRRVRKGKVIKSHDINANYLLAIQNGWACSCRVTKEGKRQIIDLYLPGDIIGLRDHHAGRHSDEIIMLTEGLVIPMLKSNLDRVTQKGPHLVNAVLAAAVHQSNLMTDRLNNLISHDATTRLAYFILEMHARLNLSRLESQDLSLPISQQTIGDLLSMTNVHVCRCLNILEAKEFLMRNKTSHNIHILKYEDLIEFSGFSTAYSYFFKKAFHGFYRTPKTH
ncbi:Crp/Fnr family transcriptional regulator [Chromohalobacter sp. HP20-39]|uniref:Crp/Fnr family transcriptional regulator n=1 Tax=Chromohalobacter sp. HP20-39 TaxID=3079306 RepID=UPI00294B8127|nr:Crp/Fnr family transcriptional regulator [Chromohalobacter sp. HP20-39]MDV6319407.1 Crp/Fnr family transcriptional regulator [Chromohalobacter sp. HP20-39]